MFTHESHLTVCRSNFATDAEFEAMVGKVVVMLLQNRQISTVRYEEPGLGIVDIRFNPDEEAYGCDYPEWLTMDEREELWSRRTAAQED